MAPALDQALRIGPYTYRIRSELPELAAPVASLYGTFPKADSGSYIDFDVSLSPVRRRPGGPARAIFRFDHRDHFAPVERRHAFATLEWGMNWCVSVHCNEYLKLHAGVVATETGAIVLPGVPGAGKSTLCALLGLNGWRVLSDEHALVTPGTKEVTPIYRPISLKNESITLIETLHGDAIFGPPIVDTHKGTVSHLKADQHPDTFDPAPVTVRAIVFPQYRADGEQQLARRSKTSSFLTAAYHAFNYSLLGTAGFEAMRTLIDGTPCYDLQYRDPAWALRAFDYLARGDADA
ncbi:HprK-related kinase A [Pseudohaliea sp.]|uniref:HprK-related kinase A n=1 Tax=Pseudohaliea sp. TaxID=2740289 RepID=UPI0032EB87BF